MKLCRFNNDRLGLVEGATVYDVSGALDAIGATRWPQPPGDPLIRNLAAVSAAAHTLRPAAHGIPLDNVTLHSPVTAPNKVMAAPANYRAHIDVDTADPTVSHGFHDKQLAGMERPTEKLGLFLKANSALAGQAEGVALKWLDRRNDPEVELVVVIGKTAKDVPADKAFEHIAGYTLGLDTTVRGTEDRSWRKSADTYASIGPWLVTADEIPEPEKLTIWLDINGVRKQQSSTSLLLVGIRRLIEFASSIYTLYPGDVIYTGTPEGVTPIKPGDRVRIGCDAIGEMELAVR